MSAYTEAENYILNIPKFGEKHTLQDTKRLLCRVFEKRGSRILHVAGTNGKGSVCAYLRAVLMAAGYRVGLFTSPHLVSMRERICMDNEMIPEEDFVSAYEKVRAAIKEEAAGDLWEEARLHPSFFEFLYLMAMFWFAGKEPDFIILETGLGGRLDATNSVSDKEAAIITHMGLDHTAYLGNTLPRIAAEKAGIMKEGAPVIYWETDAQVSAVLAKNAKKLQIPAFSVSKKDYIFLKFNHKSIDFSYQSLYYNSIRLRLNTRAFYQMENAVISLRALEVVLGEGKLSAEVMQRGIAEAFWAGRMEEILPEVYVDGAHNGDGIRAFLETVAKDGFAKRRLLFGVMQDKDYRFMTEEIAASNLFADIFVVCPRNTRAVETGILEDAFDDTGCKVTCCESAEEAFRTLLSQKEDKEPVYIAGSLYLVGEIKELL